MNDTKYHYCAVCREPRQRAGWCTRCKGLRDTITAVLADRPDQTTAAARRREIHRRRVICLPTDGRRGNR